MVYTFGSFNCTQTSEIFQEVDWLTRSLGMNYSFRDPLAVKMGHLIEEDEVLQCHTTSGSYGHSCLLVINRMSMTCCQDLCALHGWVCTCDHVVWDDVYLACLPTVCLFII